MKMEERVRTNLPDLKPTVQTKDMFYWIKVMHYHSPVGYIHCIRVVVTPAAILDIITTRVHSIMAMGFNFFHVKLNIKQLY